MKPALSAVLALVLFASTPADAQSLESMDLASNLGTVLASEEFCGLSYEQDAIAAFIEQNVNASDMGFASILQLMTDGHAYSLKELSPSARTAHCTQIRRVAKSYGFISE